MKLQKHIAFFNKVRALAELYADIEDEHAINVDIHSIDLFRDDRLYLEVYYSYTNVEGEVVPAYELIPTEYLDIPLAEAEQKILRRTWKNDN